MTDQLDQLIEALGLDAAFATRYDRAPLHTGASAVASGFDESQHPREHGRFTTKDGGSSEDNPASALAAKLPAAEVEPLPKEELAALQDQFLANSQAELAGHGVTPEQIVSVKLGEATAAEPVVTADLRALETRYDATMVGLDYRLKGEGSLERKLITDMAVKDLAPNDVADSIADSLRYTYTADSEHVVDVQRGVLTDLQGQGYQLIKSDVTWNDPGAPYRGMNAQLAAPGGTKLEVQFHTPESFVMKERFNHPYYEEARLPQTAPERADALVAQMARNSAVLTEPANLDQAITQRKV